MSFIRMPKRKRRVYDERLRRRRIRRLNATCDHTAVHFYDLLAMALLGEIARLVIMATGTAFPRWSEAVRRVAQQELEGDLGPAVAELYRGMFSNRLLRKGRLCSDCRDRLHSLATSVRDEINAAFALQWNDENENTLVDMARCGIDWTATEFVKLKWNGQSPGLPPESMPLHTQLVLLHDRYKEKIREAERAYVDTIAECLPVADIPELVARYAGISAPTHTVLCENDHP